VVAAAVVGGWLATRRSTVSTPARTLDPPSVAVVPEPPLPASASAVEEPMITAPSTVHPATEPPIPAHVHEARPVVGPSAPTPSTKATEALPDEATLLRKARSALRSGEPHRALALLDVYPRRFPNGMFGQERDVLRIDALVALGRSDEAQAAARAFLAKHPESAHRAHVEAILKN
jgi:hypothetical protein